MNDISRVLMLITLLGVLYRPASAWQYTASSEFQIRVYGLNGASETLMFGNRTGNTFGVDSLQPSYYRELEPAPPSPGFDCIWILPPGRTGQWGSYRGLLRRDWRSLDGSFYEARQDTWALSFSQNDDPSAFITFKWPDPACLLASCDSIVLIDPSTALGWPGNKLDMTTTDTLAIAAAGDRGIRQLRIIKYGVKLPQCENGPCVGSCGPLAVGDQVELPADGRLSLNYPNPFNPSTTVEIELPARSGATLSIYDLLGREVARIFEGVLEPGHHEFLWDAGEAASGVYIARLTTTAGSSTHKLVLAR